MSNSVTLSKFISASPREINSDFFFKTLVRFQNRKVALLKLDEFSGEYDKDKRLISKFLCDHKVARTRFYFLSIDPTYYDYDITPLVNALTRKIKFQHISKDKFIKCRIYFKYTGSNIFGTITNNLGEVSFVYSSGIFEGLHTRKEKTTIFVAQQLGELICLRLYKSNAQEIYFIPFINHTKSRALLRFFVYGFRFIHGFKVARVVIKRKVMRNGVRLAKPARK